jgi:hypothetical protein
MRDNVGVTLREGALKLEDLHGEIEYDVFPPDHPQHFVAHAIVISRVHYSRPEDASYPHRYKTAWNRETGFCPTVTQESLDNGSVRPAVQR